MVKAKFDHLKALTQKLQSDKTQTAMSKLDLEYQRSQIKLEHKNLDTIQAIVKDDMQQNGSNIPTHAFIPGASAQEHKEAQFLLLL